MRLCLAHASGILLLLLLLLLLRLLLLRGGRGKLLQFLTAGSEAVWIVSVLLILRILRRLLLPPPPLSPLDGATAFGILNHPVPRLDVSRMAGPAAGCFVLLRASTQGAADGAVIQVSASMARPGRSGEALGLGRLVRLRTALLGRLQPRCLTTSFVHPIPCRHVSRVSRATRTIRKRIPVQGEALHTQETEPAPVPA